METVLIFQSVQVLNYRSIGDSGVLDLGPINVLIGRNNAGKSALLRAIYTIQDGSPWAPTDIRIGQSKMTVRFGVGDARPLRLGSGAPVPQEYAFDSTAVFVRVAEGPFGRVIESDGKTSMELSVISGVEPDNAIFPVFSDRRLSQYPQSVRASAAKAVDPSDNHLVARLYELLNSDIAEGVKFRNLCKSVLGFNLNVFAGEHDQQYIGLRVSRFNEIRVESMGRGLTSALSLLIGISCAESNKLFLIEEPENDLHPHALKALLDAIVESSATNQFIISTHSSVVLSRLGSVRGTVVIHTTSSSVKTSSGVALEESRYRPASTPSERIDILRDLGYEPSDLELGEGWLVFEESSMERLVREHLIRWFCPGLLRLRTIGANGAGRLEPLALSFNEMILYAHREPLYRGRAWFVADGDKAGRDAIARLQSRFSAGNGWPDDRFVVLSEPDLELYYPEPFVQKVTEVLSLPTAKNVQWEAKQALFKDLLQWIDEDDGRARHAFAESAKSLIKVLTSIEDSLRALGRVGA